MGKQRMQMRESPYKNSVECAGHTWRHGGGLRTFYRSYPITLALNVPFMASYFVAYESLKHTLKNNTEQPETIVHIVSGAGAGAVAGFLSNPPDVIKTRIQTDMEPAGGLRNLKRRVWMEIMREGRSS